MNRDDIIRMARECGLTINDQPMLGVEHFAQLVAAAVADKPRVILERGDVVMDRYLERIKRMQSEGWRQCAIGQKITQHCTMAEEAVAAEREACARMAEECVNIERLADDIRARGK